jgi:hypothetical protein
VTLWTRSVGLLLGRWGATASHIRAAIDGELRRGVQLTIGKVSPPDNRPPEFAGAPLQPKPGAPSTTAEADDDPQ